LPAVQAARRRWRWSDRSWTLQGGWVVARMPWRRMH